MSDQKICPTCSTEYPLSERFCPRDGTALRSATQSADLLGSVIADRYHILKKLGEGGMGTVYLAEHVKMGRKSALKVMNPGMNTDPDAIARFNREASNASRLSHPNICGIYDFGETTDGIIYLAMEFIEGSSLSSLIEKGGQLPAPRAASIIHQTADALQVAHDAGIVHRDLKPDNIMVAKNRDGSDLVKVVDFGIAKASSSDAQKVTKTGMVVGTPEYMSPEQLSGDKLDGRSDIYSLGLVAFNCLTGTLPFASETAQEAMIMRLTDKPRSLADVKPGSSWPAALQATLDRALARDTEDRYASAAQFGRDFAAAIADMPMTRAVEAGTMVMNAAAAGKVQVPETRVNAARPSAKTLPMDIPAAAKKPAASGQSGSKVPMLAGVGGGLALMVGVGLYMSGALGGGTTNPNQTAGGAPLSTSPQPRSSTDSSSNTTGPSTVPLSTPATSVPNPGNPAGPGSTKAPRTVPDATTKAPEQKASELPGPTPLEAEVTITKWRVALEAVTEADQARIGRSALREIEPMIPKLTGFTRDDAFYVGLIASAAIEDSPGICRYGASVLSSRLSAERKGIASRFMSSQTCPQ